MIDLKDYFPYVEKDPNNLLPKSSIILTQFLKRGLSVEDLVKEVNLSEEQIINFLTDNQSDPLVNNALREYYKRYRINSDKILVISDTHLGREKDDKIHYQYLQNIYNFAVQQNIKYAIHAGDIVEEYANPFLKPPIVEEQLEELKRLYVQDSGITTYYILGNHDYLSSYDQKNEKNHDILLVKETLKQIKGMEYIGVLNSYINLYGEHTIKIYHTRKNGFRFPTIDHDLELIGHGHLYGYCQNRRVTWLPGLFKINDTYDNTGFVILSLCDDGYLITPYLTKNNVFKEDKDQVQKFTFQKRQ